MRNRRNNNFKIQKRKCKLFRRARKFKLTLDKKGNLLVVQHADTPIYDADPMPSIKPEKQEGYGEQEN